MFSGLTALTTLSLGGNDANPLPLTVTVEKVGTDQARAKVLAGAPFSVDIPVTLVGGTLAGDATALSVAAGSVEGTAVIVTRTAASSTAVTVDVDLTTQPTLPTNHNGYTFVKSASGLPATILPGEGAPAAPTGFTAAVGNGQVLLTWDAPQPDSGVTRHEYRYKTTGSYGNWTQIDDSEVGGLSQAGFTVPMLTNEVAHTFEVRAVNASGEGAAAIAGPVTPTPGICGRTEKIQEAILAEISGVSDCAAVTVANLAAITSFGFLGFGTFGEGITSLQAGDFAGLTSLSIITLEQNGLTSLPADVFSGLTSLITLSLNENALDSLPADVFSGLTSLVTLALHDNALGLLPPDVFSGLTSLKTLTLGVNSLGSLRADVFSGLTVLTTLRLQGNNLVSLPDGVFSGLTALEGLSLDKNQLNALPDGVFSGLTSLVQLDLSDNPTSPLPLTVTVEKVGTDQARAKVLAGAPFSVDIPVTLVGGTLAGDATALSVAAGSVDGTEVTVTRTAGTTAAVTVDVDLTTQPTLPLNHRGYTFVKSTSGLPASILPAEGAPTNFTVAPGDGQVVLSWDAPASDSGVTRHEYRHKTTGSYGNWTQIANSGVGAANEAGFTVPMLTNEVAHTFELRAVNASGNSGAVEAGPVTPTPGICGRTQQVQDEILRQLTDVSDCAAVTVADLATVGVVLDLESKSITSLKAGDFAGLTAVTVINLQLNQLGALPANLFSGLTILERLDLSYSGLTSLPADAFSGLTALTDIDLGTNGSLGSLPASQFSELTRLRSLELGGIGMTVLHAGLFSELSELTYLNISGNAYTSVPTRVFSGLSKLEQLNLGSSELGALPAGVFSDLTALRTLYLIDSKLTTLPAGVFSGLTALTTLNLSGQRRRSDAAHRDPGEGGERPGAGEGARGGAVRGGDSGDGGGRDARGQRDQAGRGGGLGGGHGGHRDPHGRDDGGGDGGRRPDDPADAALGSRGLRVRPRLVGPAGDRPAGGADAADADGPDGHGWRRAGDARLGRAGVGFGRHAPRVPVQDGRELRKLDADCEQRAGRDQRVRVHGDGARQRDGPHL